MRVFDVGGRLIKTLLEGTLPTGGYSIPWLGDDAVFAERPFTTSPPFPGLELEPGDPMEHELFPVVFGKN